MHVLQILVGLTHIEVFAATFNAQAILIKASLGVSSCAALSLRDCTTDMP